MASTFSSLKIELIGTGEKVGTWGTTTNINLGTALEEAITGSADVTFASGTVTLTLTDVNTTQSARNLRLNLIGTSGGAQNLIVPAIEKLYLINNACADAITVKNSTGTGIAVPAGKSMFVYNNATNVVDAVTYATGLAPTASPTFTGTVTIPTLVGTDTTDATSPTAAAFKTAGGLGVAKDCMFGKNVYQTSSAVGSVVYHEIRNTATSDASFAIQSIEVDSGSIADPMTNYKITGAAAYTIGIDNADSDKFWINVGGAPGLGGGMNITSAGDVSLVTALGGTALSITSAGVVMGGSFGRGAPVGKTADFTVADTENWLINNKSGSDCTVTLPSAASYPGREIMFINYQAFALVSASSNVVQRGGGAAGTSIIAAVDGGWATLVSNGTNWLVMQGS